MKTNILLIRIGGGLNVLFLLFHLAFYWMFDWKNTLACLSTDNRAIYLTFNIIMNCLLFFFVVVSLFKTDRLLAELNGKRILFLIVFFYLVRMVCEFVFWGFMGKSSVIIILMCLAPALLYGIPLLTFKKN